MSTEANKTIVRRLLDAINTGDLAIADELIAPGYIDHSAPPGYPPGPQGFTRSIGVFRAAFPDFHWATDDLIAEGDKVVIRVTARGTHQGELMGIAPTGKRVQVTGIGIYRIADGKIAEAWVNRDLLGLLQQLGAIPAPGGRAT
jgi:predicted ester cyclase